MTDATDELERYSNSGAPETLLLAAWAGEGPLVEAWMTGDYPQDQITDEDVTSVLRYVRADLTYAECDMAEIPARYAADAAMWRDMQRRMTEDTLADLLALQETLDANAPSTRDRLQRVRADMVKLLEKWQGRVDSRAVLDKGVEAPEDMI